MKVENEQVIIAVRGPDGITHNPWVFDDAYLTAVRPGDNPTQWIASAVARLLDGAPEGSACVYRKERDWVWLPVDGDDGDYVPGLYRALGWQVAADTRDARLGLLLRDYGFRMEGNRLISVGVPGFCLDRVLGVFRSPFAAVEWLMSMVSDVAFRDRYFDIRDGK